MMKNTKYARSRLREKMLLAVAMISCKPVKYSVDVAFTLVIQEMPQGKRLCRQTKLFGSSWEWTAVSVRPVGVRLHWADERARTSAVRMRRNSTILNGRIRAGLEHDVADTFDILTVLQFSAFNHWTWISKSRSASCTTHLRL